MPDNALIKEMAKQVREKTPDELKNQALTVNGLFSGFLLVPALVVIFGGIRMLQLRSFGICVLASLLAATPVISPTCCCGVGALVGIWSIVVLLAPTVRLAFR
jgi:hypothetical protein